MLGYSPYELEGLTFRDITHPEDLPRDIEQIAKLTRGEIPHYATEKRYLRKDGTVMWGHLSVGVVRGNDDRILYYLPSIIDITERKQAEGLYAALVSSAPVGIYIIQDHRFVFTNPVFQTALGYTADELLVTPPAALIHPEDVENVRQQQVQMLKGETFQPYEYRAVSKNGEIRWTLERVTSITYGGTRAVLGISINITERKQAEQLYHTLADSSPVGVYIVQDGKFVFANPAFLQALGYTADELLGRHPLRRIHPEDREGIGQNAVQMLKGKRLQPYEFRFFTKSGETRWSQERVTSIIYQGRRATLGNFVDITESKQAHERIEHAAEEWRRTFDSITDPVSILDKDFRLVRVNKAYADMFKKAPKELLGKACYELVHGTNEPWQGCPHKETMRTGRAARAEFFEPHLGIFLEATGPGSCEASI